MEHIETEKQHIEYAKESPTPHYLLRLIPFSVVANNAFLLPNMMV